MKKQNLHASLLALVGGYLFFTAWNLWEGLSAGTEEMPAWSSILFIALFTLGGIGVLAYAYLTWKKAEKDGKDGDDGPDEIK